MEEDMLPAKGCLETKAFIEEMAQAEHKLMKRAFERERRIVQLNQADRFARRFGKKEAYRFEEIEVKRIEKGEVLPQMNEIITLATVFDKAISFRLQ